MLAVAIPIVLYAGSTYALYHYLVRELNRYHVGLFLATIAVVATAVALSLFHVNLATCLLVLMFAPLVTIIGHEVRENSEADDAKRSGPE